MTIGENIRRIRKLRKMTVKDLADRLNISDTYLRYYENNARNPKKDGILRIAEALNVNPEVLQATEIDQDAALHRLFHIFSEYNGRLLTADSIVRGVADKSISGNEVFVEFQSLKPHLSSWLVAYADYAASIDNAEQLQNPVEKANAILEAQKKFNNWMDFYPETLD